MAYFSSSKTEKGTAERLADCYQCLSFALARRGAEPNSDADLITEAVEAGWDEDEVSTILQNIRRDAIANVVSEDLVSESEELPPADAADDVSREGR